MTAPCDLDAIEARAAAATPGPWERTGNWWVSQAGQQWSNGFIAHINGPRTSGLSASHHDPAADFAFIAHARTDVPAMAAELRELRAEVPKVRGFEELYSRAHAIAVDYALALEKGQAEVIGAEAARRGWQARELTYQAELEKAQAEAGALREAWENAEVAWRARVDRVVAEKVVLRSVLVEIGRQQCRSWPAMTCDDTNCSGCVASAALAKVQP